MAPDIPPAWRILRRATDADVDTLVALINAAFEVERFFIDGDRTDAAGVRSLQKTGEFLLAEDAEGQALACVYLERRGQRGYFGLLSVAPARKGRGIGRQLMAVVEGRFREEGCQAIDIRVVNLRAELPPMYRRLGYVETGTEPFNDPRAYRPCHFILMSKTLGHPAGAPDPCKMMGRTRTHPVRGKG